MIENLLSPVVLAFALGVLAALIKSDLRVPEQVHSALSMYLLLAIGLKGGVALSQTPAAELWKPALGTLLLGAATMGLAYLIVRRIGKFSKADAAAIGAHYGSVSAVTFVAALDFVARQGAEAEGFMPGLVALLEVPAIILAIWLAKGVKGDGLKGIRPVLTGKCIVLLVGGMIIGAAVGPEGFAPVEPVYRVAFAGALLFFLLEMGVLAGQRLAEAKQVGVFLGSFAILMPLVGGALGVATGWAAGMSLGGATVLGCMAASASYIAAPAAVKIAIPEANPGYYLTASLGITFPFNILFGIPLYFALAGLLFA